MSEGKFEQMWAFIKNLTDIRSTEEHLKKISEITSERSEGNYDDCFEDGATMAEARIALDARTLLKELGL